MGKPTFAQLRDQSKTLFGDDEERVRIAALLLSSMFVGTDAVELHRFTGYESDWIHALALYLRSWGIWSGDTVKAPWIQPGGLAALIADVLCLEGWGTRLGVNEYVWNPSGKELFDSLTARFAKPQ